MKRLGIGLLIVAVVALLVSWFLASHEKVEDEFWTGFRGEARANNFHAAQLLLQTLGYEAESRPTLTPTEWMPDYADTLLVRLSPSLAIGDEQITVLDWIASGGHAVFLPPPEMTRDVALFLETFSLALEEYIPPASEEEEPAQEFDNEYEIDAYVPHWSIELLDDPSTVALIRNDGEILVARRDYGDGYVTLLADAYPLTNSGLNSADNARLFADVLVGELEAGKVWISYESSFAPLWLLVWNAAPLLVVSVGLLLLLWFWHAAPAFGPKAEPEAMARRSIVEHIRASGVFAWRKHGGGGLEESAIQALVHEAGARHPGLVKRSAQEQAEIIARITGMQAQKVLDALQAHPDPKQREFTNSMQKLQSIRKEL